MLYVFNGELMPCTNVCNKWFGELFKCLVHALREYRLRHLRGKITQKLGEFNCISLSLWKENLYIHCLVLAGFMNFFNSKLLHIFTHMSY